MKKQWIAAMAIIGMIVTGIPGTLLANGDNGSPMRKGDSVGIIPANRPGADPTSPSPAMEWGMKAKALAAVLNGGNNIGSSPSRPQPVAMTNGGPPVIRPNLQPDKLPPPKESFYGDKILRGGPMPKVIADGSSKPLPSGGVIQWDSSPTPIALIADPPKPLPEEGKKYNVHDLTDGQKLKYWMDKLVKQQIGDVFTGYWAGFQSWGNDEYKKYSDKMVAFMQEMVEKGGTITAKISDGHLTLSFETKIKIGDTVIVVTVELDNYFVRGKLLQPVGKTKIKIMGPDGTILYEGKEGVEGPQNVMDDIKKRLKELQ